MGKIMKEGKQYGVGGDPKSIVMTTVSVTIPANQDYFYIPTKSGYSLVSCMFTSNYAGNVDRINSVVWDGSRYAGFLVQASTSQRTMSLLCVWVSNSVSQ